MNTDFTEHLDGTSQTRPSRYIREGTELDADNQLGHAVDRVVNSLDGTDEEFSCVGVKFGEMPATMKSCLVRRLTRSGARAMASSRGILNIQSLNELNELTSEKVVSASDLSSRRAR